MVDPLSAIIAVGWYIIGFVGYIHMTFRKRDVVVFDIFIAFIAAFFGPLIFLYIWLLTEVADRTLIKKRNKNENTI